MDVYSSIRRIFRSSVDETKSQPAKRHPRVPSNAAVYRPLFSPKYYGDYVSKKEEEEPLAKSRSEKDVPPEVAEGIEAAITAIKTQPRTVIERLRKTRKNGKNDGKRKS